MNNTTVVFCAGANVLETLGYVLIFTTSLVGNTMVITVVKRNMGGKLRSVSYYLIFSLAVADLMMTIGNVPERITRSITCDTWIIPGALGIAICKIVNFVEKMAIVVAVSSLAAIAVDRFLNVFFPHRIIITSRRCFVMIGIIWFFSAFYCLPILLYGNLLHENGRLLCKTRVFFPRWTLWFLPFLVILFVSLFFVFVLYFAICVKLCIRTVPGSRDRTTSGAQSTSVVQGVINRKVAKMVAAIVIAFYVCFLPYWLSWIFCSYHFTPLICNPTYSSISVFLSYANISLNPIIYVTFSENFREGFKSLLRRFCVRRKRARVHPTRPRVNQFLAGIGVRTAALYEPSVLNVNLEPYRVESNKNRANTPWDIPYSTDDTPWNIY